MRRRGHHRKPDQIPIEEYVKVGSRLMRALEEAGEKGRSLKRLSELAEGGVTTLIILVDMKLKGYVLTLKDGEQQRYYLTAGYYKRKEELQSPYDPRDFLKPA